MIEKQLDYSKWCLSYGAREWRNIPFSSGSVGVSAMSKEPAYKRFDADH